MTHHQEFISRDTALETEVSFDLPYSIKYKIHFKISNIQTTVVLCGKTNAIKNSNC